MSATTVSLSFHPDRIRMTETEAWVDLTVPDIEALRDTFTDVLEGAAALDGDDRNSRPNHFFHDDLGDPGECTGEHNHPVE